MILGLKAVDESHVGVLCLLWDPCWFIEASMLQHTHCHLALYVPLIARFISLNSVRSSTWGYVLATVVWRYARVLDEVKMTCLDTTEVAFDPVRLRRWLSAKQALTVLCPTSSLV